MAPLRFVWSVDEGFSQTLHTLTKLVLFVGIVPATREATFRARRKTMFDGAINLRQVEAIGDIWWIERIYN